MIDREFIGYEPSPHSVEVEKGRLRFFARVIGETDPVYTDEDAAKAAGFRSLPVPPTMLFCLDMEVPNPFEILDTLGVDIGRILHGEQTFVYHADACAGDTLTYQSTVSDIFDKKGGKLEFIVEDTKVTNQDDAHVADLRRVLVVRN